MHRRLIVLIAVLVLILNALPTPVFAQEQRGVDVVIILDTSGPMLDGFDKFCVSFPQDMAALQQRGFDLQVTILGITKPYACATDTVRSISGSTVASDSDWGAAISDMAAKQPWRSNSVRLIVPLSNRGPALGDPVDDPGADRDAIKKAIGAAQANRVVVLPVLGASDRSTQPDDRSKLEKLALDLAQATGGQTITLNSNVVDPTQTIFRVIGQVTQVDNSTLMLSIPGAIRTLTCQRDVTKCISLDPGVLITNALVTLLIVSIAGLTTVLFSASRARAQAPAVKIDERVKQALNAGTQKVRRGYRTIFAPGSWTIGAPLIRWLLATALIVVFVGLTALLTAFIDPQFTTTTGRGIAIFLTLFAAIGLVTWLAAWSEVGAARQAKLNAALRVRPLTLVLTLVAVLLTRALNFLPGFLVALFLSYAIFNADDIRKAEQRAALRSLLLLVIIIIAAYLLAIPVDLLLGNLLAQTGSTVAQTGADAAGMAESLILTIYLVALQYAFYTLLPSRFTNGSRLFELNRVLWGVSFGLITFTLLHTAINPTLSGVEVFRLPPVIIIGGLLLVASAVALAMWLRVNDRGWQNDKPQDSRLMLGAIALLMTWVFVCGCAAVYLITQIGK
ncbi:hypothetical protein TFLX_02351 [Thermoflexales bacterium]|nr:hypothetical protein TFLX_02351 [Thermoflexales bacterium]